MEHNREVTSANSHAVLISELTETRRHLWTVLSSTKKVLPKLPELERQELLIALMEAEKYLTT